MSRHHEHADDKTTDDTRAINAATGWKTWVLTSFAIYPVITTLALGTSPGSGPLTLAGQTGALDPHHRRDHTMPTHALPTPAARALADPALTRPRPGRTDTSMGRQRPLSSLSVQDRTI